MSTVNATNDSVTNKRVSVTAEVAEAIAADYKSGSFTQAEIAKKHGISLPTVNRLVKAAGAKPEKRKYTHKDTKFTERNAQVVQKWQAGASTRDLATEFGVTHQNISLILKKAGHSPVAVHRDRLTVRATARAERVAGEKTARVSAKLEKVQKLSELWKSGAPIGDIREAAGLKSDNAAQVKIVLLRRKHPELFPKRPAFGRTAAQTAEAAGERLRKVELLSEAWNAGKTVTECATVVGWSEKTLTRSLPHLRKQFGVEKFAYRRQPKSKESVSDTVDTPDFTAPQA
jgi:DNA-binding CsgD family transcriptional regulator